MRTRSQGGPYLRHLEIMRDRIETPDAYPYSLPVVRALGQLTLHPRVTFLVGENGTGKSTLLEALAVACGLNAEGGSQNFRFATRMSHSPLHRALRVAKTSKRPKQRWFLRAESFYNVATEIERIDAYIPDIARQPPEITPAYGGRSLHEQSHGESFLALFEHRFGANGLYVLDEPEAALSPERQLRFLQLLHDHVRHGSQFVIATHSPLVMAYPDATIYVIDDDSIRQTRYEDTRHFLVMRGFLANPPRALEALFEGVRDE